MARVLTVKTPQGGQYNIFIGHGGLDKLANVNGEADIAVLPRAFVVTNTTLAPLYGEKLAASLPNARLAITLDGEQYKTLETVRQLYNEFVDAGLNRDGTVFALGGGVLGDTAGFAAASYMRGVPLVQIPTTLLSMVDSSVGGKVGVDLPQGKNLVGAFKQPEMVVIDLDVLDTLPDNEWRNGMAEVIKHGLIADETLLASELHTRENAEELVGRAIQVKIDVVQQDPYEQGIRAHLNLGHTFGHAIERVTQYQVAHGEGVAVGLLAAARLSARLGFCDAGLPGMVEEILTRTGLPTRLGDLDPEAIYTAMGTDKKRKGGSLRFVLIKGIGEPFLQAGIDKADVIAVLDGMRG